MAGPSDDEIAQFTAFTDADPQTARLWLERYVATDRAVDEFFSRGGTLPPPESQMQVTQWDESAWDAQRDGTFGPPNKDDVPNLRVWGEDIPSTKLRNTPDIENWRSTVMSEDDQLKKALAASQGQETGTIDPKDALPPDPRSRRRQEDGCPVFLRPLDDDLLGPLFTILHAIPKARNAFLRDDQTEHPSPSPHWWNGEDVSRDVHDQGFEHFEVECARLVAFLTATVRAYGSVAGLQRTIEVLAEKDESVLQNQTWQTFLHLWTQNEAITDPEAMDHRLFTSQLHIPDEYATQSHTTTDMLFPHDQSVADTGGDLLDVMENYFLEMADNDKSVWLSECADVLIIGLSSPGNGKPIGYKIPEIFDSSRFFESQPSSQSIILRRQKHSLQQKLRQVDAQHKRLTMTNHPTTNEEIAIKDVLSDQEAYLKARAKSDPAAKSGEKTSQELLEELEAIRLRLDSRIVALEKSREDALAEIQQLSKRLNAVRQDRMMTDSLIDRGASYSLRGVALSPTKLFVQAGANDPEDLLTETNWQWWRMEASWYTGGTQETFNFQSAITSTAMATKAAQETTSDVLLVYANEAAIADELLPMPGHLLDLVGKDNASFEKEFSGWSTGMSPSSTIAENSDQDGNGSGDVQMSGNYLQEGQIRLQSEDDWNAVPVQPPSSNIITSWGTRNDQGLGSHHDPTPPDLPPRQNEMLNFQAPQALLPVSGKRKTMLSGLKNALSRSKSRERSKDRDSNARRGSTQDDLLIDNDEQSLGIPAMHTDGTKKKR